VIGRVARFVRRHRGRAPALALARLRLNLYARRPVRTLARMFYPPRHPRGFVFVVGCYNSGTTLVQQLLGAHPDLRGLPDEGARLTSVLTRPEDLGWNRVWVECERYLRLEPKPDPEAVAELLRDWAPWISPEHLLVEKSVANTARMPWLGANFPDAHFVGVHRDGYCVAEGIRRRARPKGPARAQLGRDRYPIELAGRQWVVANARLLEDGAELERFHLISYERLLAEPDQALSELWSFLGVDPCPVRAEAQGISVGGQRFDLFDGNRLSLERLDAQDLAALEPVIGPMRRRLGYAPLE
jgi:hypothetical protein